MLPAITAVCIFHGQPSTALNKPEQFASLRLMRVAWLLLARLEPALRESIISSSTALVFPTNVIQMFELLGSLVLGQKLRTKIQMDCTFIRSCCVQRSTFWIEQDRNNRVSLSRYLCSTRRQFLPMCGKPHGHSEVCLDRVLLILLDRRASLLVFGDVSSVWTQFHPRTRHQLLELRDDQLFHLHRHFSFWEYYLVS